MTTEPQPIGPNDTISFACSDKLDCFNQCCINVNQFLYPYDILRLRKNLGLTTSDFIDKYLTIYSGDTTGLPVASFKTYAANDFACPFVTPSGCSVYTDRPAACRLFPLARAISRSRETCAITEHFALIKDPICKGFCSDKAISVQDWVADQKIAAYNRLNDLMIELISLKQQRMPGELAPHQQDDFILGCYNLDSFRQQILGRTLSAPKAFYNEIPEAFETADDVLVETAMIWLKHRLFGQ